MLKKKESGKGKRGGRRGREKGEKEPEMGKGKEGGTMRKGKDKKKE